MYLPHVHSSSRVSTSRASIAQQQSNKPFGGLHVITGMLWTSFVRMVLEVSFGRMCKVHWNHTSSVLNRFTDYRQLHHRPLADVTQLDVDLYFARRRQDTFRGRPVGPVTLNNEVRILNQWLRKAGPKGREGNSRKNWALTSDPPLADREPEFLTEVQTVTAEQLRWFRLAADQAEYPRIPGCTPGQFWKATLALALVSALRRRALLSIPRPHDQMLQGDKLLLLPAHLHKTRQDFLISLGSQEVANLLAALPSRPGQPLIPWRRCNGTQNSLDAFTRWWAKIQQQANVPEEHRFHLKALRATAATMIAKQFSETIAKQKLGHSPRTNTLQKHYLRRSLTEEDVRASVTLGRFALDAIG